MNKFDKLYKSLITESNQDDYWDMVAKRYEKQGITKEKVDLPDGEYDGYFYGYFVMIEDKKYPTFSGTKQNKQVAMQNPKKVIIKNGIVKNVKV